MNGSQALHGDTRIVTNRMTEPMSHAINGRIRAASGWAGSVANRVMQ